jgi:hypothetical protein
MNWKEMEERHQQEFDAFSKLKAEAWEKLQSEMDAVKDNLKDETGKLPRSVAERLNHDYKTHRDEWGFNGTRLTELRAAQQKEKDALYEQAKTKALEEVKKINKKGKEKAGMEIAS